MTYKEKEELKEPKTYSYVGFLNGYLNLNTESAKEKEEVKEPKTYSYVGFLNGHLHLNTESEEIIESLDDNFSQSTKLEEEICQVRKRSLSKDEK